MLLVVFVSAPLVLAVVAVSVVLHVDVSPGGIFSTSCTTASVSTASATVMVACVFGSGTLISAIATC